MRPYRLPLLLSLGAIGGLLAALAFDGLVESLAVSCVGVPLLVIAYFYGASRATNGLLGRRKRRNGADEGRRVGGGSAEFTSAEGAARAAPNRNDRQ